MGQLRDGDQAGKTIMVKEIGRKEKKTQERNLSLIGFGH